MAANDKPDFIHQICAKEAEQLLLTKGIDGSFLVRTSATERNVYALSHRKGNRVFHIRVKTNEDGFTAEGLPGEYPTIAELIVAVQRSSPGFDYPLLPSDPAPPGLEPRLFFGRLASKQAEKLLLDPDAQPERNFLIRSSTSRSKDYALSIRQLDRRILHVLINYEGGKYIVKSDAGDLSFDSFQDLLHKYTNPKTNCLRDANGGRIELMKAMICPWNVDQSIIKSDIAPRMRKKQNDIDRPHIPKEYQRLLSESCTFMLRCEIGRKQENISKNRYKNILPYDDTRVILDSPSDYINANYLTPADEKLNAYIGCQGPLGSTVPDFWRMIWQEKSRIIVMLTKTIECGKNKCVQYWPRNLKQEELYGQFHVTAQEKVSLGKDYTIIKLIVEKGDEKMEVYHCHYTGWPERSVPTDVKALVKFCQEVLRLRDTVITDQRQGPIVAHCSAGIGRTGTYVLISMIIDYMQTFGSTPDIFDLAKTLRQQRPGMVQTAQQYELVYQATNIYQDKFTQTTGAAYCNVDLASGVNEYGNVHAPS